MPRIVAVKSKNAPILKSRKFQRRSQDLVLETTRIWLCDIGTDRFTLHHHMLRFKTIHAASISSPRWRLCIVALLWVGAMTGCEEPEVTNITDYSADSIVQTVVVDTVKGDSAPPIEASLLAKLVPADGFDFPVAPPDAKNYYKARGFLPNGLEHLGEDWNGPGGGNRDFGDKIYATASGVVFYSAYVGPGWGTVLRILHNYGTESAPRYIESLYAHVSSAWVRPGWKVNRGEVVGTIGNANWKYHAHLHFEMRRKPGKAVGCGYAGDTLGFVDPTAFIEAHRPK
jgi:hypothetical protein